PAEQALHSCGAGHLVSRQWREVLVERCHAQEPMTISGRGRPSRGGERPAGGAGSAGERAWWRRAGYGTVHEGTGAGAGPPGTEWTPRRHIPGLCNATVTNLASA